MTTGNHNWDDNIARVFIAIIDLIREFKIVTSILILGVAITLGWLDVPVFEAVEGGLVELAKAAIPGIGQ